MLEAAFWGWVGGFALVVGAIAGIEARTSQKTIGLVMAFGAGVLISALAFELTAESFERGGGDTVALGLAAGGLGFFLGDWLLDRRGGDNRKRSGGEQAGGAASAIVLGALMDGIPESVAIGYAALGDASASLVGFIQAFAAGAILVMLADTMMPESFKHGGNVVGLVTLLGFALAFLLSQAE